MVHTDARNKPFVGLTPFEEHQALYFFGRQNDSATISSNLIASRLTVLYGPSGCGKSSVLEAGVAHQVNVVQATRRKASGTSPEFAVVTFRSWRDDPKQSLLNAIRQVLARVLDHSVPESDRDLSLADALDRLTDQFGGSLLIVLDQFEEYFLYHGRTMSTNSFAHALVEVLNRPDLRVNVLISIREDALAKLDAFEGQIHNLFANTLRLDPLDHQQGREAIQGPIDRYNEISTSERRVDIEPSLIEGVLEKVEAGAIDLETSGRGKLQTSDSDAEHLIEAAYLQLVMSRLWEEERSEGSRTLRLATFQRLGGAEGIVRRHLDTVLSQLPFRDRLRAEKVLTYLVTPSGSKIALDASYLGEKTNDSPDHLTTVLDRLAAPDCRVVRKVEHLAEGTPSYELFHDVLGRVIIDDYVPRVRKRRLQKTMNALLFGCLLGMTLFVVAAIQRQQAIEARKTAEELKGQADSLKDKADIAASKAEKARQTTELILSDQWRMYTEPLEVGRVVVVGLCKGDREMVARKFAEWDAQSHTYQPAHTEKIHEAIYSLKKDFEELNIADQNVSENLTQSVLRLAHLCRFAWEAEESARFRPEVKGTAREFLLRSVYGTGMPIIHRIAEGSGTKEDICEFEGLYWSTFAFVEDKEVESAMVRFRNALQNKDTDLRELADDIEKNSRRAIEQAAGIQP